VVRIITGLSVHDTRIVDELRTIHYGRISKGKIIKIDGKVPVGMRMSLARFADAVSTKLWENVARVNWRSFEEARAFVQKLKLKSIAEWRDYCSSGKKPNDIPNAPWLVYADSGWAGMGDWLGTANRRGNWRPFEEARAFTRTLGLKDIEGWRAYCRSGEKPNDIPAAPSQVYADAGWIGMSDWLDTDIHRRGNSWRPFEEARTFARTLGIRSISAWQQYAPSGKKPTDIPAHPNKAYADHWIDWNDWLGADCRRVRNWRDFEEARAFARSLKLHSLNEWAAYCRTGKKPNDVPVTPIRFMLMRVGLVGLIGSGMAELVPATRGPLRKLAPLCENSNSTVKKSGSHIAGLEKTQRHSIGSRERLCRYWLDWHV
jgi:hypothetical protein